MDLAKRIRRVKYGLDTPGEFALAAIDKACLSAFGKCKWLSVRAAASRLRKKYRTRDCYQIKDARLPLLDEGNESLFFTLIFEDTFASYCYCEDSYAERFVDLFDSFGNEGLYGLVNDKVNVTVEPGDVVIDAGSWLGDFAAYASARCKNLGGVQAVYAFEPMEKAYKLLLETAKLNENIIPVKKGLSDTNTSAKFMLSDTGSSFITNTDASKEITTAETVTLDSFVRENKLERVDFIKADIEGFERHMLQGAQETLRKFAPKLALCTYHLPDDPQVLENLIKQANPNYNVVQKRKKLYASVPK